MHSPKMRCVGTLVKMTRMIRMTRMIVGNEVDPLEPGDIHDDPLGPGNYES